MGRTPCCAQQGLKKEPWSPEEDELLINYINQYGYRNWSSLPKNAGLQRCGISCRLPWTNYLAGEMGRTPCDEQGLKKEKWSSEEDELLINYNNQHGHGNWDYNAKTAGLQQCGESSRHRWTNYLAGEMRRAPCYDKQGLKTGAWSFEEDELLINYINQHGYGNWKSLPKNAGLQRKGKSCRFRWTNYLRPGIKRGPFTPEEENLVIQLYTILGNRWSAIAIQLPGRTDNEIKNLWNTHLRKRLVTMGLVPQPHEPTSKEHGPKPAASPSTRHKAQWESARLETEARLSRESLIYKYSPHCSSSSYPDVYLRLWNSEVGESFRKVAKKIKTENSTCQIPVTQISSATKSAFSSGLTQRSGRTDNEIKNDWNTHLKKRLVTHEPTSKAASRSTRHNAQWENARLEAQARFSRESLIYNPHCSSSSYCDVYLRLWNSEVGESFRKVGKKIKTEKSTCQSPVSETSPTTKCAFSSGLTQRDEDIEVIEDSKSHIVFLNARSTSSCSDVVDDDFLMSELQLLLDFPENNDMSFLENPSYDYFDYPPVLSND